MKRWLLRIAIGFVCIVLLAVVSLFGLHHFERWTAQKARVERSEAIRAYHPSQARVYLYSLDPKFTAVDDSDHFHGYRILGSSEITASDEKAALILSLSNAISHGLYVSMCFEPQHGLRIINDAETVDLVICFSCLQIQPFNFNGNKMFGTAGYPFAAYNAILERHGLPVFKRK